MLNSDPSMATLYHRLKEIGFDKSYVKKILPDWWDRDCETHPEDIMEGMFYISRRLNLELDSLLDPDSTPRFKATCQGKFKARQGQELEKLKVSYSLASRVAELAAYGCKIAYQPIEKMSEVEIRQEILKDRKFVDLEGVLNFCWRKGIPVVHFSELPKGANKFEGVVTYIDLRPIIVVSSKHKSTIKLLFIVLHELGHIYKQHINNSCWIDSEIKLDSKEPEEIEANQVAKKIIFKDSNANYYQKIGQERISSKSLVSLARSYSEQEQDISPESIIMNYSWYKAEKNQNRKEIKDIIWRTANKALKIFDANSQALQIMQQKFRDNLDWDKLSEDNQDYLEMMTGLQ